MVRSYWFITCLIMSCSTCYRSWYEIIHESMVYLAQLSRVCHAEVGGRIFEYFPIVSILFIQNVDRLMVWSQTSLYYMKRHGRDVRDNEHSSWFCERFSSFETNSLDFIRNGFVWLQKENETQALREFVHKRFKISPGAQFHSFIHSCTAPLLFAVFTRWKNFKKVFIIEKRRQLFMFLHLRAIQAGFGNWIFEQVLVNNCRWWIVIVEQNQEVTFIVRIVKLNASVVTYEQTEKYELWTLRSFWL